MLMSLWRYDGSNSRAVQLSEKFVSTVMTKHAREVQERRGTREFERVKRDGARQRRERDSACIVVCVGSMDE